MAVENRDPTPEEIREACRMIQEARAHAGIMIVSKEGSESSPQLTGREGDRFSPDRLQEDGPSWQDVLSACFEWDQVSGVYLRNESYERIATVKRA